MLELQTLETINYLVAQKQQTKENWENVPSAEIAKVVLV